MNFPVEKYKVFYNGNKVIAVSTYAGRTVRGVAKCDPRDDFDKEKGSKLAIARCAAKIADKRAARATKKVAEATNNLKEAQKHLEKMSTYLTDSQNEVEDIKKSLKNFELNM